MSDVKTLATVWLDGCSGCHMSLLDMDERLIELSSQFRLVYSPLVDRKTFPDMVDVTLVEGAVASEDDLKKIRKIREHTRVLVSLGDCALTGNVSAMRNMCGVQPVMFRVYDQNADLQKQVPTVGVPALLNRVCPVHEVVPVDVFVPGCPPSADTIYQVLSELLAGKVPSLGGVAHFGWLEKESRRFMPRTIVIDPVTRLEGHGKITLQLDEAGIVQDATFHVTQLRGFEKFTEGRPFYEMPNITARICGICPVSHLVASSKACDAILAVKIPPVAADLRRILNLAQLIQSHALSFFYLSSPDLLLGMDAPPEERSILHVAQTHPTIGADGIALRSFGQKIIELLAGRRIHPGWTVPGGVNEALSAEKRGQILAMIPAAKAAIQRTLGWFKGATEKFTAEIGVFANFPTLFMGLVNEQGLADYYDGALRVIDSEGNIIAGELNPAHYADFIGEAVEPYTYMKFPYYKPLGYPGGTYRVGPLARLNLADHCDTPLADVEWREFRAMSPKPLLSSFYYHHARLVEMLHATETIEALLSDEKILDKHVRATASVNNLEGIGVAEAPRGTLIHHYKVDENGLITWANLIIATGHNNAAMNRGILQTARHYVHGDQIADGMLNRVEAVVRTFDPCLSCSTHAMGRMPLSVELRAPDGALVREIRRG